MLDPLLLVVAFSEMLLTILSATHTSYADNTKVVQAPKDTTETILLQNDLIAIYKWAVKNNNGTKLSPFLARHKQAPIEVYSAKRHYKLRFRVSKRFRFRVRRRLTNTHEQ